MTKLQDVRRWLASKQQLMKDQNRTDKRYINRKQQEDIEKGEIFFKDKAVFQLISDNSSE
jgi:hypothetical protein